jgi:hypothetical protein
VFDSINRRHARYRDENFPRFLRPNIGGSISVEIL